MAIETDSVTEEQGKHPTPPTLPLPSSHPSEASHAERSEEFHPRSLELWEEVAVMTHKLDKDKLSAAAGTCRSSKMRLNPPGELHEIHRRQEVPEPELQQQQVALETAQKVQTSKSDSTLVLSANNHNLCASPNNYQVAQLDDTNSLCPTGYTAAEEMLEETDGKTAHKARNDWPRKKKVDHKNEQPTPTRVSRPEVLEKAFDATTRTWYIRVGETPHSNHLETIMSTAINSIHDEQSEQQQRHRDFEVEVDEGSVQDEPVSATDLLHDDLPHNQPGAFPIYPSGNGEDENATIEEEPYFRRHEESIHECSNGIVVEAALVVEEEEEPSERLLIEAEPVDHDDAKRIDDAKRTIVRLKVTLLVLVSSVVLLALIVGLSMGLTSNTSALPPPTTPTDATTVPPTMAPTIEWRPAFWESLPKETKAVIRSGFSSSSKAPPSYVAARNKTIHRLPQRNLPQYKAFEWVTEMDKRHLTLSQEEILPRMTQRFALATLFYATVGEGWIVNTNWLDPLDECQWTGCNCDGKVDDMCDSLKLDLTELSNTLPNELKLLSPSLMMLAVRGNSMLGGSIPVALGGLVKLTTLLLSENVLSGTIPTQLGNLINLVRLDLGRNGNLIGQIPTELGKLSLLTHLGLHNNALTGTIPSELGSLQKLESLFLYGNNLDGTVPVEICNLFANKQNATMLTIDCNDLIHCNDSCHCTCAT